MALGLSLYRGATSALGRLLVPALRLGAPAGSVRLAALTGASEETARAAGSIWIHAASMGEVGVARLWARALASSGARPPFLLTTRTRTGLERAARELGPLAAARMAPIDAPHLLRGLLDAACPARLDIVETEIWPNLIHETRRAGVAVVFVSASVSSRTAGWLRALGLAGRDLFGEGVFVLAQGEGDAARFASLGVPEARIRTAGDLKADAPTAELTEPTEPATAASRPAVVFGSLRPGEEETAVRIAAALEGAPGRPVLVVAPRHDDGARAARAAFTAAGYEPVERDEASREDGDVGRWIEGAGARPGRRVALLTTHGELAAAYGRARVAVIGGTFAPFGGHNPVEAAARGAPVVSGPFHEGIAAALAGLRDAGAAILAAGPEEAAAAVLRLWDEAGFPALSEAAIRGARSGAGATARALDALDSWGLSP